MERRARAGTCRSRRRRRDCVLSTMRLDHDIAHRRRIANDLAARLTPHRPGAPAAVLGRAGRGGPAAIGVANRGDRFRANRDALSASRRRRTIGRRWLGGPRRRRRCGLPIADGERWRGRCAQARRRRRSRPARSACCSSPEGRGAGLGFDHPKGMFPIGPVSGASLLQIHFEKALAAARRYGAPVPIYMMTSPVTHDEQAAFLEAARAISACRRTMSCCFARARCRRSMRQPASCCSPKRIRCS